MTSRDDWDAITDRLAAAAPPFTTAQVDALRILLSPTAAEVAAAQNAAKANPHKPS